MIEKLASRKGDTTVNVVETRETALPEVDFAELDEMFKSTSTVGSRHSIALGELVDDYIFPEELPRKSQLLKPQARRPRAKQRRKNNTNPLKSMQKVGEASYTENRTNLPEMMNSQFSKRALAGLAAKEDVTNVRLRSASRTRDEELTPYKSG